MSEVVRLLEAETGRQGWEEGARGVLTNGYRVSVLLDEVNPRDLLSNTGTVVYSTATQ